MTRMVDGFYADVQALGGRRWDTSSPWRGWRAPNIELLATERLRLDPDHRRRAPRSSSDPQRSGLIANIGTLGLQTNVAITAPHNKGSAAVLEKIGMRSAGMITVPGNDTESCYYTT